MQINWQLPSLDFELTPHMVRSPSPVFQVCSILSLLPPETRLTQFRTEVVKNAAHALFYALSSQSNASVFSSVTALATSQSSELFPS